MSGKPEGGPKPLKKKSETPKVVSPGTDPLLQPTSKPVEETTAPKPSIAPSITTIPVRPRVIAPSITKITPARPREKVIDGFTNRPTNTVANNLTANSDDAIKNKENLPVEKNHEAANTLDAQETSNTISINTTPDSNAAERSVGAKKTTEAVESVDITSTEKTAEVEKPAEAEKPAKKGNIKKIVLILAVSCVVLALGALAAYFIITSMNVKKPVADATIKLFSDEQPRYVQFKGKIEANIGASDSNVTSTSTIDEKIDLTTGTVQTDSVFSSNIFDFSYNFTGIRDKDNNYYFDLAGINKLLLIPSSSQTVSDGASTSSEIVTFLPEDSANTTKISEILAQTLENKWLQIPASEIGGDTAASFGGSQLIGCWANTLLSLPNLGANAKTLYEKNPFISYSTKNLKINQKYDELYHLSFDNEKMADFLNSITNFGANNLFDCMNIAINDEITASDVAKILPASLDVYVEINQKDEFTRLYFEYADAVEGISIKADLGITYLSELSVEVPSNFVTLAELQNAITEALKSEEPEAPEYIYEEGVEEQNIESSTPTYDYSYYDDPAQDVDTDNPNSSFNPDF